jgi:DNA-binding NarL/FixJ family response regulator
MDRISVYLWADDPISAAGLAGSLRPRPELEVLAPDQAEQAQVAVVLADSVDPGTIKVLHALGRSTRARLVLVAAAVDDKDLLGAVEAGVSGVVRRSEATPEHLTQVIVRAASGEGALPSDLLGRLLVQVSRLQRNVLAPRGLTFSELSSREAQVLRLVADGLDTQEIATRLCYSERTVKNVLHDVTNRLQLRNRSHAVAYALREGLI